MVTLWEIFLLACSEEPIGPEVEPHAVYDRLKEAFPSQCQETSQIGRWGGGHYEPKYRTTTYRCEGVSVPLGPVTTLTGFTLIDYRHHRYEHLQGGKGWTSNTDTFTVTYFFSSGMSLSQSRFASLGAGTSLSFGQEPRKVSEDLVSWEFDTGDDTAHSPKSPGDAETPAAQIWAGLAAWQELNSQPTPEPSSSTDKKIPD